jgi:hypothetical protein
MFWLKALSHWHSPLNCAHQIKEQIRRFLANKVACIKLPAIGHRLIARYATAIEVKIAPRDVLTEEVQYFLRHLCISAPHSEIAT